MAVCIVGSSRSGTSMVTRLLNLCGLHLGPNEQIAGAHEFSNPAGYWENLAFQEFNEELLVHLGGCWYDPPPAPDGWALRPDLAGFRTRARKLIAPFAGLDPWGWKDPRNSLTLEFWQNLIPGLRVVVCLRHPLEAATSIRAAVIHSKVEAPVRELEYGLELWARFQDRIMARVEPGLFIVSHYESHFFEPAAELARLLAFVGLEPSNTDREAALATIEPQLRRNVVGEHGDESRLPPVVADRYRELCRLAGPVYSRLRASSGAGEAR